MIKLTNASADFDGDVLILNSKYIISIFSDKTDPKKSITTIYGITGTTTQTWQVKESIDEIYKMFTMIKFIGNSND